MCARQSFHKQYEQVGKTDLSQLVTTFCVKWKGEKKVRGFLPVCIQSKCSMSKRGFIIIPVKRQPSHKHENTDVQQGQHNLAMLFCTTNYSSLPLRNATGDR